MAIVEEMSGESKIMAPPIIRQAGKQHQIVTKNSIIVISTWNLVLFVPKHISTIYLTVSFLILNHNLSAHGKGEDNY